MKSLLRLSFVCLASLTAGTFAQAQTKGVLPHPPPPFPPGPRPPVIWIDPAQGRLKPMEVQSVDAKISVRGHLATTTMEMTFFNPNTRVLEGELVFPLGEGQTIAGYALEVEGKMRQAVVIEKEKGREVFEEVVRRGVDPGLAEITKGNVFRTRVYPLPPKGVKRVSVTFEQELAEDGKGFRYLLPLAFEGRLKRFHVWAEVVKQEVAPVVDARDKGEALTFDKWRDSFVAELLKEDEAATKPLAFTVPKLPDRPQVFMVSEKLDPENMFFNVRVEPEIPPVKTEQAAIKHVALFYDASGSAEKRDRRRENEFLKAWLKSVGDVTVHLVSFRNDADPPVTFDVKNGDAGGLIKAIEALPVDGGTSLGAVNMSLVPEADTVVLMSDGLTNFGPAEPKLPGFEARGEPCGARRLFVIHAAQMADAANLNRIARKSGGRVLNLITMRDDDALAAMRGVAFQFLGVKVLSGKADDMIPSLPEPLTRGFTLAGKFKGKTEIELSFGYGTQAAVTRRVTLNPDEALEAERGDFVRRAWVQRKIGELMLDEKANEATITALGKEHRVVTSGTSLLVLDRLEDYARHQIEPPEPELREQYLSLLQKMPKNRRQRDEAAHLDEVAKQWTEFREWHAKRHPWLETVIKTAAEREVKLYALLSRDNGRSKPKLSAQDAEKARELLEKAKDISAGWSMEGRQAKSRAQWIREATGLMMQIDALHQRRAEAAPESEVAMGENGRPSTPGAILGSAAPAPMPAMPVGAVASSDAFAARDERPATPMALSRSAAAGGDPHPAAKAAGAQEGEPALASTIEVKPWNPDTPYLKRLKNADDAYVVYLKERKENAGSSAFFLDCADFFREEKKDDRIALRVLSNLAEMELESAPLLRILAYRLQQIGRHELAVPLFEAVLKMRGEEPQSRRDLALALSRMDKPDFARAASLLWEVVRKTWDSRFPGIEIIAVHELNDLLARAPKEAKADIEKCGVEKRFLDAVPLDLRVVLTWDADNTDIDLWVTDPAGETCIFNHNRTQTGGRMSNDFTQGYGPEVFTITRALPGTYTVRANYYGNHQQKYAGATTVQIEFETAFDRKGSKREAVTRRLTDKAEVIEVGKFVFRPEMMGAE